MLTRTLTFLLVVILMVVTKELKCKKLRSGNKKRVNLNRDTYIFFPTNGVRTFDIKPGAKSIDSVDFEPIDIYSKEGSDRYLLIMRLHLRVNYAAGLGGQGTLELLFEHDISEGCGEYEIDGCSMDIRDSTLPLIRFCDPVTYTATNLPIALKLSRQGNFLVVTHARKFVAKAAIPHKKCDITESRQLIHGIGAPEGAFIRDQPHLCQEWLFES